METPRESFRKIMHYERPERMFNWNRPFGFYGTDPGTQFWQNTIDRWHQEGLPAEIDSHERVNDFFGADRSLRIILKTEVWPPREKQVIEDDGEYETFYDGDGALVRQPKGADFETAMPQHLKYSITSRDDWEQFKDGRLDPNAPGREVFELNLDGKTIIESAPGASNFNQARQIIAHSEWPVEITIGSLFGKLRNWMGLTGLSYILFDDESLVVEIMSHLADLSLSVVTRFLEALDQPVDFGTWWEDMAFNKGPLISPKHIQKLMVPNYQRVNEYLYNKGIDIIGVDSDGKLDKIIPLWLEGGINFVYPNEVAAGNDVVQLRQKYGRQMRLVGGIDKRSLAKGEAAIRVELEQRLSLVSDGGYLPSVDHSVPPDISFENYMKYLEFYREECQHNLVHIGQSA
jgi:uroporphyrinogen decarboxylase